ncbi:MAG TPA: VOC family protein [Gemmatimonadaceae bacterium]|nr:VOC family protein [Gemmatimonadaceae bacterium]
MRPDAPGPPRMIFLNLAVRDLDRAKAFFSALGFTFNPQFTDDIAACMILSEMGYVMLLREPFFQGFMQKALCDTRTHQEALVALSCTSRAEVDELLGKAIAAGGSDTGFVQDHGFMYGRGFHDLDGHHWEIMWMDPSHVQ